MDTRNPNVFDEKYKLHISNNECFFNLTYNSYHPNFCDYQQVCIKKIKGPFTKYALSNTIVGQFQKSLPKRKLN